MISPGTWKMRSSPRRVTMRTASTASRMRPTSPPTSWNDCTRLTVWACAGRGSSETPGESRHDARQMLDGSERRAVAQANISEVTIVVLRYWGWNSSTMLGRLSVPAAFFCCQTGDSGRNGRIRMSGSAGITPEISVYRQ